MVDLEPLRPFLNSGQPSLPGYAAAAPGGRVLRGKFGSCHFIVTQDIDGHTEVSLSVSAARLPSDAQAAAFFRKWGVEPESEIQTRRMRFWLVERGTLN